MTRMEKATLNETVSDVDLLLRLQECDKSIRLFRRELDSLPDRARLINDVLAPLETTIKDSHEKAKACQASVKTLDLEIQGHRERIARIREQQLQAKTNKDYQALQDEINKIQATINSIEDRQLSSLDKADQFQAAVEESEHALTTRKQTIAVDLQDLDKRQHELESLIKSVLTEREALSNSIKDLKRLQYYNRVMENKQDEALVQIENGNCGACHLKLQPQLVHDARRLDLITVCSYCGRMLFLKNDVGRNG